MLINKDVDLDILKNFIDGKDLELTKDVVLDREKLIKIFQTFPHAKITILSGYDEQQFYSSPDCLYDNAEVKILAENVNLIRTYFGRDILFDDMFTVEQAITASRKINDIVHTISNAKLNNKPLSPYEKFLWAFNYVTEYMYTAEGNNEDPALSRNLISVLNGDKIVCVGFTNMLNTILNRLGIPCTLQTVLDYDPSTSGYGNHQTCCVRIDDDKYNKHGIYYSDPTSCSRHNNNFNYITKNFNHSLLTYKNLNTIFKKPIALDRVISNFNSDADFNKAVARSENIPKILSYLFPEKNNNLPQGEVIKSFANNEIINSNVNNYIDEFVDAISPFKIQESFDNRILKTLDINSFINSVLLGNFKPYIESTTITLAFSGLSKEEIITLINSTFNNNKISEALRIHYKSLESMGLTKTTSQKENDLQKITAALPQINNVVNSFSFETAVQIDPEEIINDLSNKICKACVNKFFFNETENIDFSSILTLQNLGFDYNDIITAIKNQIKRIDLSSIYINRSTHLYNCSHVNERELYATGHFHYTTFQTRIFNDIYEEDFLKLQNSATPFTNEDISRAFTNIYLSQGYDKHTARQKAYTLLQDTNLIEQYLF